MKRKFLSILVLVMLLVMLVPSVANAQGNGAAVCAKPYSSSEFAQLERMVEKANKQIANAVNKAQNTPFDDVAELVAYVDGVVADVMGYANSIGASVVCEYTAYVVDGQTVMIDPLRVIPL
jgi:hypothetical protein